MDKAGPRHGLWLIVHGSLVHDLKACAAVEIDEVRAEAVLFVAVDLIGRAAEIFDEEFPGLFQIFYVKGCVFDFYGSSGVR